MCIVDGCPPGLLLGVEDLLPDLRRRRPGQSKIVTQRARRRRARRSGPAFSRARPTVLPSASCFRNTDQRSGDYGDIKDKYRPGHADFTFDAKYGFRDYRGGGRSSARETLCRVAAAAIAKKLLTQVGVRVIGYVKQVGAVSAEIADPAKVTLEQVEGEYEVRLPRCGQGEPR